jgi:hypothetical protein
MIHTPARITTTIGRTLLAVLLLVATGCVGLDQRKGHSLVPGRYLTRAGPFHVWTNEPLEAETPAVRELMALEHQVQSRLGLRTDPQQGPIEIYILDTEQSFRDFLAFYYPELPTRRAFFLAREDRRVVYTYFGDRLAEDLRHEATHALLHASLPRTPLWLDEGLAEYFEVPTSRDGLNTEHLARLPNDRESGWSPDLKRLEELQDVRTMTPRDYRESWAWVHYLIEGSPANRAVLLGYLADLRGEPSPRPLSARLSAETADTPAAMLAHLDQIPRNGATTVQVYERRSVYRGQDPANEPPLPVHRTYPHAEPRRGFFSRFFGLFGLGR